MYKKILLIDDDADEQFIFIEAFKDINILVKFFTASTGEEGIRLMKFLIPDIVFLDINMPGLSGFDCLKIIKRDNYINKIPVVIYSTGVNAVVFDDAVKNGAITCIKKQDTIKELTCLLKEFLVPVKLSDVMDYDAMPFV